MTSLLSLSERIVFERSCCYFNFCGTVASNVPVFRLLFSSSLERPCPRFRLTNSSVSYARALRRSHSEGPYFCAPASFLQLRFFVFSYLHSFFHLFPSNTCNVSYDFLSPLLEAYRRYRLLSVLPVVIMISVVVFSERGSGGRHVGNGNTTAYSCVYFT